MSRGFAARTLSGFVALLACHSEMHPHGVLPTLRALSVGIATSDAKNLLLTVTDDFSLCAQSENAPSASCRAPAALV